MDWSDLEPYSNIVDTSNAEPRAYQINIIKSIAEGKNELVVLPTGLGKTLIAIFAMAMALYNGKKALMLAPTKPLSEQHFASLSSMLKINSEEILLLTGATKASKRAEAINASRIIIGTPQTAANDLSRGRLSLNDFGIVVFDECHRAVGRYAYTYIANEAKLRSVQIIGLTASPGSDRKKIAELINTLGITKIEVKSSTDPDVQPYVHDKTTNTIYVDTSPEIKQIMSILKPLINAHLRKLYDTGLSPFADFERMPKRRFLEIGDLIKKIEAHNYKFAAIFNYVYVLDLVHAYDLVSTEGLYPFASYINSLKSKEKKSKVVESIIKNPEISRALEIAESGMRAGLEHPKMLKLVELLRTSLSGKSIIIFAQFRSTIKAIVEALNSNGMNARGFIGRKEGITQADQAAIIKEFREKKFDILVATSIGEEGLDIPAVDCVIFYEPIPSEIRSIQRKGRAGRFKFGEVIILVARATKDEGYLMISRIREKRMLDTIIKIRDQMENGTYRNAKPLRQARL